jgi:hypothetical protein
MKITVKLIKENKDGSADAEVNFDQEGWEVLVQWGLVAMLTKAVSEYAIRPDGDTPVITGRPKRKKKKEEVDMDGRC